jgi:hypothetical protein
VLRDGLHPADQVPGLAGGRFQQKDLEGALECVLGVLGADREAAGGAPQRLLVLGHHLDRDTLARGALRRRPQFRSVSLHRFGHIL